jgi:hypothetical protein
MPQDNHLAPNSVLFWLVASIVIAIILIGARFIVTPLPAARDFGVPAIETEKFAYLRAKGTRDIVSGLLLAGLLWMKVSPGVVAVFLLIASLIPLGDLLNVYANSGTRHFPPLMIHGGTALFMCVLAVLVIKV